MIATAANLVWLASQAGAAGRFRRQLGSPAATQQQVLRDLLRRNAACAYGRAHGFADIRTPEEFASRVPLTTYDDLVPWISRIMRGERSVLTSDPVSHLVPTSGSSGARKLIPFTSGLQKEFNRAISPWITDLYSQYPSALLGPSYWSISPAAPAPEAETSAVPIGFDDDTSYLGDTRRRLVAATMAVPTALREAGDTETFILLTLTSLVRRRDLRLISVWHPSFLLLLLEALPRHWETIIGILETGRLPPGLNASVRLKESLHLKPQPARARQVRQLTPDRPDQLWPHLAVVSCWTDGHAALGAKTLAGRLPQAVLQPKGLLATEAVVTLPFAGAHPVAINSHYYEFMDESGAIRPVEGLQQDRSYEVIVSTGGGLWRYRLRDRVRVDGYVNRTPSLRFMGRAGNTSDLFGEKLTEEFVTDVIAELSHRAGSPARFALLAPEAGESSGGYILFWDGGVPPDSDELDRRLMANPHYAWCRQLGQLRPARVFVISQGAEAAFYQRMNAQGRKLGDIKLPSLVRDIDWSDCFTGNYQS